MTKTFCLALVAALSVSACATHVNSTVEAHSAITGDVSGSSVYVKPMSNTNSDNLQWRTVASHLYSEMQKHGITKAESAGKADYVAYLGFAIDNGQKIQSTYSIPQYGQVGVASSYTTGYVSGNSISANTMYTPSYGVTGYSTGVRSHTEYTRGIGIDLVERKTGKSVYEVFTRSSGTCGSITAVSDELIKASLRDFPNGKQGRVIVPLKGGC